MKWKHVDIVVLMSRSALKYLKTKEQRWFDIKENDKIFKCLPRGKILFDHEAPLSMW